MNAIQPFITQHPWMTFFIVLAALECAGRAFVMVASIFAPRR